MHQYEPEASTPSIYIPLYLRAEESPSKRYFRASPCERTNVSVQDFVAELESSGLRLLPSEYGRY